MPGIPDYLKYSLGHAWVEYQHGGIIKVGITDYAQQELGEIVFIELPETKRSYSQDEECVIVESVKTTAEIYCPVDGEVIDLNRDLEENPELINIDPYGDGWIFQLRPIDDQALDVLIDANEYLKMINQDN